MQSTFFFFYFLKAIKANIRQIQFHLELKRKERFLTVLSDEIQQTSNAFTFRGKQNLDGPSTLPAAASSVEAHM